MKSLLRRFLLVLSFGLLAGSAAAQEDDIPYWVSLVADEAYMRVGPSITYPIDWVYKRPGLPMRVLRVNEGWRYVEDPDGMRGWIAARMFSRARGAIVTGSEGERAEMRADPAASAAIRWYLEPGVVGELGECDSEWCVLDVRGHKGWVSRSRLWGTGAP